MNDLRKAAEMALEALESVYGKGKRCEAAIKELRQALALINPNRESAYAGVRMWIGCKEVEYWVTKVCIEQEMIEGMSMKFAADSCLKALKENKE